MKTKILTVFAVLMLLLQLSVNAANYKYSITVGDSFISAESGDDLAEISEKLNMNVDELKTYFNKNGLLYIAVSETDKIQIMLSAYTDNYSSEVSDISNLSAEQLDDFINSLSNDGESHGEVCTNNGRKYAVIKSASKQTDGDAYTLTRYITICDGQTFCLSCYNIGEDTSKEVTSVFETFSIAAESKNDGFNATDIIIIAGIVIFAVIAIIAAVGIIKQMITKSTRNNK